MVEYRARVADDELTRRMQAIGATLIEGPKACGKTATASQVTAAVVQMDRDATARASVELNPEYLFRRPTPILFDEWQVTPELWNLVRRAVDDADRARGLYLLTGSATPKDDARRHSGAGRIGVLQMRTMSLYESRHSTGEVSLTKLLDRTPQRGAGTGASVPQIMERIVIGGWPELLDATESEARQWLADYLRQIVEVDIPSFVGRRNPRALMRLLASLARFVAQAPATRTLAADVGGERGPLATETITAHLDALDRLKLLDDSTAWQPHMRSRSRLRVKPTRYFVDPSLATAALQVTSTDLLRDLPAAGFHFKALVVRDLRIFTQALGGWVDTWRDESGNEIDAILNLPGGRWAAVEIKLGQSEVDHAAANLLRFAEKIDTGRHGQPAALIVITATGIAGQRPDGVHVTPITALAP